jgi:hypothetical protein
MSQSYSEPRFTSALPPAEPACGVCENRLASERERVWGVCVGCAEPPHPPAGGGSR